VMAAPDETFDLGVISGTYRPHRQPLPMGHLSEGIHGLRAL